MISALLKRLGFGGRGSLSPASPHVAVPTPGTGDPSFWSRVLSHLSEGVLVLDPSQKVLFANPAAAPLLIRPPQEAAGRPLWDVLRHREVQDAAARVLSSRKEESGEIALPTAPETLWLMRARPLPDGASPAGAVLTFHDITSLRRLENTRKEFVANVSHELRTPLTALRAALETLLDGAVDDPGHAKEFLETAQQQVDRLQRLIDDLLSLARLEKAGTGRPPDEVASLSEVAERVMNALSPIAQKNGVSLENRLAGPSLRLAVSEDELTQVLMNLLDNAVKFNKAGGRATLSARAENTAAEITIQDTGIGIPAEDLPRIFERFYRVDKARSRELGGTGLGLSIVKHIVENRGGRVRAESAPHQGSAFFVTLPLA